MLLTVLVALAAAVAFGWSTAAMQSSASMAPDSVAGPLSLVRHLVGRGRWLGGMAASLLGLALHTVALRLGSLAVVQPLVVTGLVFTFAARALLERRLPERRVLACAGLTTAGLIVFLVAGRSTTGRSTPHPRAAAVVLVLGLTVTAACIVRSRGASPSRTGLLLGTAAGVVFGLIAGTLKATSAAPGLGAALTSWPLYVLVGLGVTGFLLNQLAYREAPLTSSVPVLNVLNPLVALAYGAAAFDERPAHSPLTLLVEAGSLVAVLVGVFLLARTGEPERPASSPSRPAWPPA